MVSVRYFAYGANMVAADMARRCPSASVLGVATLQDHRFQISDRGGATVIRCLGSVIYGVLWSISETDLAALDYYEGVPDSYRRKTMDVLLDGNLIAAEVYVATSERVGKPWPGYLEKITRAACIKEFPLPYIRHIQSFGENAACP